MKSRRKQERLRRLKSGKIVFNRKTSVVDCTVRNLSEDGACLQVESVMGIPATFDLVMDGVQQSCTVTWRNANRLGVSFQ